MEKYNCECGINLFIKNKKKHEISIKHKKFIKNKIDKPNNELQDIFIKSNIQKCILLGNPGCGKTKTIIDFCIHKFNNKIITCSKDFLIISFSKKAQLDFISRSTHSIFNNNNVKTIHSLASCIYKKLVDKTSTSVSTIVLATLKDIQIRTKTELLTVSNLTNCKFIIVDEAQDINENQYNLLNEITNKLDIPLIMVGDPNQNIYQFQNGSDKYLLNHSNNIYNLLDNYRSCKEIIDFLNYLKPHKNFPLMRSIRDYNNNKPIIYCNNINNIIENILEELRNNEYKLHEIAIIGPVKKSKYNNNNYSSIGLNMICNILQDNNINFIKHFRDPEEIEFENKKDIIIKEDHINILTSHSSKGLEFKKTLIINFHFTTFTNNPTEEEYNNFKYLWYVTMSRAREKLIIYVDSDKYIFPEITNVPKELYIHKGEKFKIKKEFNKITKPNVYNVTDIIEKFDENIIYEFINKFKYEIEQEPLYEIHNNDESESEIETETEIYEYDRYGCLYGIYIENLLTYYYYKNHDMKEQYIKEKKNKLSNIIFLQDKYTNAFNKLYKRGFIRNNILNISNIDKNKISPDELELVEYCFNNLHINIISIFLISNLYNYDKSYIENLYDKLLNNDDNDNDYEIIFKIILYFYQIENECKYILEIDFTKHLESLKNIIKNIDELSKKLNNMEFQIYTQHKNINLIGIIDILEKEQDNNKEKIIEIKFVKSITEKHIIQTLLYYNNININWNNNVEIEIWNLLEGTKNKIKFKSKQNWELNCFLCKILNIQMTNNIFMLDLETNTIDTDKDFTLPSNTEIIDRYIYEYNFESCVSTGLIKNKYKMTTTEITGITEKELKFGDKLSKFREQVDDILKYCYNPIFVAHNGKRFDFPILYYHNIVDEQKIRTLDSLFLKTFIKNKNISGKLIDIYNYVFESKIIQTHRAEGDTMLIVDICKKLNLTMNDIINLYN
jgi:thymidine kinase